MKMKNGLLSLRLAPMTAGFALATTLPFVVGSASAFELNLGEVKGSLDTTLSYGTGWRVEDQDNLSLRLPKTFANKDDGEGHFDNNSKPFSSAFKITSDLELKYDDYGVLVRGTAFYDEVIMDRGPSGVAKDSNGKYYPSAAECNAQNSSTPQNCGFARSIEDFNGHQARILDAYVYGNFKLLDRDLNVRLGEQVINWGEALFITNGINSANPASLSKLRLPGAEIKEALLPLPTASFSYGLSKNVTVEGFAQFDWDFSEPDSNGTFYSTDDAFAGYGSERVIVETQALSSLSSPQAQALVSAYNTVKYGNSSSVLTNKRESDKATRGSGQYGMALRLQPEGSDTEFGIYHMNYHSHTPVARGIAGEALGAMVAGSDTFNATVGVLQSSFASNPVLAGAGITTGQALALAGAGMSAYASGGSVSSAMSTYASTLAGSNPVLAATISNPGVLGALQTGLYTAAGGMNSVNYIDTAGYQLVYQEDVKLYGLSFSTTAGDLSFSGELAYRPNVWVLKELGDNLIALNSGAASTLANAPAGSVSAPLGTKLDPATASVAGGAKSYITDWDGVEQYNIDFVAINNFGNALGTDGLMGVLEVGAVHYAGYSREQHYASTKSLLNLGAGVSEGPLDDYMTPTAWGYRAVLSATYNDVFAGTTLNPSIRFAHDVEGNSDRAGVFMENRKAATLGVNAVYQNALDVGVAYNTFWGAEPANLISDRDSVTLTLKYSF